MTGDLVASPARRAGLFLCGILAGFCHGTCSRDGSAASRDVRVHPDAAHRAVHLDDLATAMLAPALLTIAVLIAATARTQGVQFWWAAAAWALLAAVLVTTVVANLPINTDQRDWPVDAPPADCAQVGDRWQLAHAFRTVAVITSFVLLIHAAAKRSFDRMTS